MRRPEQDNQPKMTWTEVTWASIKMLGPIFIAFGGGGVASRIYNIQWLAALIFFGGIGLFFWLNRNYLPPNQSGDHKTN